MNSLPMTVTRQRRDCDLNPGPSAPESSTLSTRIPSHPQNGGKTSKTRFPGRFGTTLHGTGDSGLRALGLSHLCFNRAATAAPAVPSRLRFEPGPFCTRVQHANHSATEPVYRRVSTDMHRDEEPDVAQPRSAPHDVSAGRPAVLHRHAGTVPHHHPRVLRVPPRILPRRGHSLLAGY